MASKTFSQLYNDGLQQADETTGPSAAIAKIIIKAGINESYAEMAAARDWPTLENNATVSTASGTMEYTPVTASASVCRIRRIRSIVDETTNRYLEEVKQDDFNHAYPYIDTTSAANQGSPTVWFESGYNSTRDLKFKTFLVPNSVLTLRVYFIEDPLELVDDGDVPRIPDQFHYGLIYNGLAKYFEYQKDPIANYYRALHEEYKRKVLDAEYDFSDDAPAMKPQTNNRAWVIGKVGRIYN